MPERGPGSLARFGRRLIAVCVDWFLCSAIAAGFMHYHLGETGLGPFKPLASLPPCTGRNQMLQSRATVSSAGSDSADGNGMLQGIGLTLESITKRLQQASVKLSQASPSTEASLLPDAPQDG